MADLPFHDRADFDDADRGFVAPLTPAVIKNADGKVVWDGDAYAFLDQECPDSAHPSLWRHGRLCAKQGLYEVADGIYQVRGLDLSNMTLVEGDTGVIVVDPLISTECAAAALNLYRRHRGHRPVTGIVYTHAHVDHFGGVRGVTGGGIPILAPAGFLEHTAADTVYAGPARTRRSLYVYGPALERSPAGQSAPVPAWPPPPAGSPSSRPPRTSSAPARRRRSTGSASPSSSAPAPRRG